MELQVDELKQVFKQERGEKGERAIVAIEGGRLKALI